MMLYEFFARVSEANAYRGRSESRFHMFATEKEKEEINHL